MRLYAGMGIHGYRYEDLLPTLRALAPDAAVVTLTADDVESYVTDSAPAQRTGFVLTPEASRRLRSLAPPGRSAAAVCGEGPFTIWLDDAMLFGGLCYERMGAAALRHPVMHIDDRDGRVRLDVGAVQGTWAGFAAADSSERERIDPPELRALFAASGRLRPLAP